jgi:tetratricopeptide (TPR) repeat protein
VYLKLAFFYEDFAAKDWIDAESHAQRCYQYYLDTVDPEDTAILARFGNLLVREHMAAEAIEVYDRILRLDAASHAIWFNKAHAQVKIGDHAGARTSLKKTLEIEPTITAAKHMLRALDEEESFAALAAEEEYVRDLFNSYADTYDSHGKKLLYSAPRVIRQELAAIYKTTYADKYEAFGATPSPSSPSLPEQQENSLLASPVSGSCSSYSSFMNNTLDILDIGCGTGLVGAWLKDYARSMIGVGPLFRCIFASLPLSLSPHLPLPRSPSH